MNCRETVIAQLAHKETERIPYHLPFVGKNKEWQHATLDAHFGSREAWQSQLKTYIAFVGGSDHRTVVEELPDGRQRDCFGTLWSYGNVYHVEEPGFPRPSMDGRNFPAFETFALGDAEIRTIEDKVEEHEDSFKLFQMGWGLWESYWGMRGYENALIDSVAEPAFFADVLDWLTEAYLWKVEQYGDLGFDGFFFSDDWGDQNGVTLADRWRELFKPRYEKIYAAAHAKGKYAFSHCCGSVEAIMPDMIEIGLDCLESVQPEARDMNPFALKQKYGDQLTFYGCLGSQSVLPHASPEELKATVRELATRMSKGGGYILAPTKNPQADTPPENIIALVEAFIECS